MKKANKDTIKENNKKMILNLLKVQDLSRTGLAESSCLSNSTISSLVAELVAENIVFEKSEAKSSGGRKPIILSINPQAVYTLLLKLSVCKLSVAVADLKLHLVSFMEYDYPECSEPCIRETIVNGIRSTLTVKPGIEDRIIGVGVSVPGIIDHKDEKVLMSSLLNLKNFDFAEIIHTCLKQNVYVFKDTDALLLGEYLLGDFSPEESCLYLLVDSGVGLSYMDKGELLQPGRSGLEIGHVQLDDKGPECNCGNIGCVEAFVSEKAARKHLRRITAGDPDYPGDAINVTFSQIVERADNGDPYAEKVLLGQCGYLGRVVGLVTNLFTPDTILIGGPLSNSKINLLEVIRDTAFKSELDIFRNNKTAIRFASAGDMASFIGMADKILDREFYRI